MYNLLIAIGAGVVGYLLGLVTVNWYAGFLPALILFGLAWFFLARRTGKQVEVIAKQAMEALQGRDVAKARTLLTSALPYGKWQFLVAEQIHGQLGALDYVEAVGLRAQKQLTAAGVKFTEARGHLEKAYGGDWRSKSLLAAIHHRESRPTDAVNVMEAALKAGTLSPMPSPKGEPIFWGLYAWILNEARKRDEALQVLGRGLQENKGNKALTEMQEALSNRKRPNMQVFGETWYQFFPEDIPQETLMQMQGMTSPPRPRPQKTWPQPRR